MLKKFRMGYFMKRLLNYIKENRIFLLRTLNAMLSSIVCVNTAIVGAIFKIFNVNIKWLPYDVGVTAIIIVALCIAFSVTIDFILLRCYKKEEIVEIECANG